MPTSCRRFVRATASRKYRRCRRRLMKWRGGNFPWGPGREIPAVPAAIDEVAEMTFPVDPRLKDRAEAAAKNVSHDLPLAVNDEVLSFLNFFQTPRGKAIVETGLRRSGRYREMIARVLKQE